MNTRHDKPHLPPAWPDHLLEWFCAPHLLEEVQGDLQEMYGKWVQQYGAGKANRLYVYHTIIFFRPFALKKRHHTYPLNAIDMLKNYFKIAFRNLHKHKTFSVINLAGLATGLAACLLIVLFIQDELSYDQFHTKKDRIYLVYETTHFGDNEATITRTPHPLAPLIQSHVAGVKSFVRVDNVLFRKQYVEYQEYTLETAPPDSFGFVDSTFFDIFSFHLLEGNPADLSRPYTIILSDKKARTYFGDENPIGKVLTISDPFNAASFDVEIVGVMETMPHNSHLQKEFLISMATADREMPFRLDNWNPATQYTYLLLDEQADPEVVQASLTNVIEANTSDYVQQYYNFHLFPLSNLYLRSNFDKSYFPVGDLQWVYIFAAIALFIMVIACINYMNLSTARATLRAQEVGLRKVVGARRKQIIIQFLSESLLIVFLSVVISVVIIAIALPFFNQLSGKTFTLHFLTDYRFLLALTGVILWVGLLSGSYPAFYLSAFQPVKVLKGALSKTSKGSLFLRKGLVVFQFTASIVLIIGTLIIYNQWEYLRNKKLGIHTDQVVTLPIQSGQFVENYQSFKTELLKQGGIVDVTASNKSMTQRFFDYTQIGVNNEEEQRIVAFGAVDYDFFETFDIAFVEGRPFSKDHVTDAKQAIIINEAAQKLFGFEQALGNTLKIGSDKTPMQVIGVVKDFHFEDLHTKLVPMVFFITDNYLNEVAIRVSGQQIPATLAQIEETWKSYHLKEAFTYSFLNEDIARLYQQEARFLKIFSVFAALAISIACLGAFGLISFTVSQRTKEIGIRKVLGASVLQVVVLLSKDFTQLVLVALLIAAPVAYFAMNQWLADFAYRIDIGVGTFLIAGMMTMLIALLTVSFQSIKAALTNPVDSLRNE